LALFSAPGRGLISPFDLITRSRAHPPAGCHGPPTQRVRMPVAWIHALRRSIAAICPTWRLSRPDLPDELPDLLVEDDGSWKM